MKDEFTNICYRLTRKCNLKCSFCFACDKLSFNHSLESIKQSIIILKNMGMKSIRLGGGEPTLYQNLVDVINFCIKSDLKVILCTNLYNIEKLFDKLIRLPISITTSIHGDELGHNNITGTNSYNNTVTNIKLLASNGIYVNIHFIVTKKNEYYWNNIIEDCIRWGTNKLSFQTFIPRERGKICKNIYELSKDDIKKLTLIIDRAKNKYEKIIKIKLDNLYEKNYYVFETDGNLYLQKSNEENDILIKKII
jgi:MoaA/NifB/PqqE/SkfB family radical SAM enzyme